MTKRILIALVLLFATTPAIAQFRIVTGAGPDSANEQSDDVIAWQTTSGGMGVQEKLYRCDTIGKSLTVVDIAGNASSGNPITLNPHGSDTINGMSSYSITSAYGSATLLCSGSGTWTIPGPAPALNPVTYLNILNFGAKGDAIWGATDCSIPAESSTVTCGSEMFSMGTDDNKTIIIDDALANPDCSHPAPLVTTIVPNSETGYTAGISVPASCGAPIGHITSFDIAPMGSGSGYEFGSTQTTNCSLPCSAITVATGSPYVMTAVLATTNTAGTGGIADGGGTTGPCTVTAASQTALAGQPSQFVVQLSGGGIQTGSTITVSRGGNITADSSTYSAGFYPEPVTGCGNLTGAVINLSYGILLERVTPGTGLYKTLPDCLGGLGTTSPGGSGLTLTCTNYSSTTSWGTDNSGAFEAAIGSVSHPAPGTMNYGSANAMPVCIYIPGGNYLTSIFNNGPTSQYVAQGYGCWLGDERYHSNVFMVPNALGDLFSWLNSNKGGSGTDFGNTQTFSDKHQGNQAGSSFRNITVIGNRASINNQNALMFYGPTEFAYINNCTVSYVRGIAFGAGNGNNDSSPNGTLAESRVENCHFDHDGDGNATPNPLPAFDITSENSTGSNDLDFVNLRFFQNLGPSMWIHAPNTSGSGNPNNAHQIRLLNVKIEGSSASKENLPTNGGQDLLKFGDEIASATNVSEITCRNVQLSNPILGSAALDVAGPSASATRNYDCDSSITGTPGGSFGMGLRIEACQQCAFKEGVNSSTDYNLVVGHAFSPGGTPLIASPGIVYDGNGAESLLTTNIDPTSSSLVQFPTRQLYAYSNATGLDANRALAAEPLISYITSTTGIVFKVLGLSTVFQITPDAPLWTVIRTGPATADFNDIWDTASNFEAKLNVSGSAFVKVGQKYQARICNQTNKNETMLAGLGITLIPGTQTITAGQCANFSLAITSTSSSPLMTILEGS